MFIQLIRLDIYTITYLLISHENRAQLIANLIRLQVHNLKLCRKIRRRAVECQPPAASVHSLRVPRSKARALQHTTKRAFPFGKALNISPSTCRNSTGGGSHTILFESVVSSRRSRHYGREVVTCDSKACVLFLHRCSGSAEFGRNLYSQAMALGRRTVFTDADV